MKNNKNLLSDLFNFFKEKYGKGEAFNSTHSDGAKSKVIKLDIIHHTGKRWAEPALLLFGDGDDLSLIFSAKTPNVGYSNEVIGEIVVINSNFDNANTLWVEFRKTIGGVGGLLVLSDQHDDDKELSAFQFELLSKLNELAYSGNYQITQWDKSVAH